MNLKKIFTRLQIFLFLISIFIIPTIVKAYSSKVILGGENIGIEVKTNGVIIVGFYNIDNISPGKEASLSIGDKIIRIDDTDINAISDLSTAVSNNKDITITYLRNGKEFNTNLTLYRDNDNIYKTGLYVKDSIIGIGTLTFIDPNNMKFGALGHEIIEKTTGQKFEISGGSIFESIVTGVDKATRNEPGSKNANYFKNNYFGEIEKNEVTGIFGTYDNEINNNNLIEVAENEEITLGDALIKTVVDGKNIETFTISIIKININEKTKNILFEVTDQALKDKTGGIIQGMSGSPIIQNNKLIGAVTHVLSEDAARGYGIFITTMLKEIEN